MPIHIKSEMVDEIDEITSYSRKLQAFYLFNFIRFDMLMYQNV